MEIQVRSIQRNIRAYFEKLRKLPTVSYNKTKLQYASINAFVISPKKKNDENNKTRESIVGAIINNKIPSTYYEHSRRWKKLKESTLAFVHQLTDNTDITTIKLLHRGGRKYNYDFTLLVNKIEYNIELKFNASEIDDAPQFVSPVKPSQYMSESYEEYFYDNYLPKLSQQTFQIPSKHQYLKEIHSNKPKCMKAYQDLYYQGCKKSSQFTGTKKAIEYYELANSIDKLSRESFIARADLKMEQLSDYLQESQKGKIYMLYRNNRFYKQTVNIDDYKLVKWDKQPTKFKYVAYSASGKSIDILLRWKNGNGIAFPAFQIS